MLTCPAVPVSRRRFAGLLLSSTLAALCPEIEAWSVEPREDELPAAILYAQGVSLMRRGRTFLQAAERFAQAARKEPMNPMHRLAEGCAYAARAASLSFAAQVTQWSLPPSASQKDGRAPRTFATKDDGFPYRLTAEARDAQLNDLAERAVAAWKTGQSLSKSADEQALAWFVQGWGLRLLRKYLDAQAPAAADAATGDTGDTTAPPVAPPLFKIKKLPDEESIQHAFVRATELTPQNPLYWQAKGDALDKIDTAAALAAYRKALELNPRNTSLWYHVYQRTIRTAVVKGDSAATERITEARNALHQAQRGDRANGWPFYEEAYLLFAGESVQPAAGKQAIDRIVQGNATSTYTIPAYQDSAPPLLAVAWRYFPPDVDGSATDRIRKLAQSATAYAQSVTERDRNLAEGVRAARAIIGMGERVTGDLPWPLDSDPATGKSVLLVLVGFIVIGTGYRTLTRVCEIAGDRDGAASAAAEYAAFARRAERYQQVWSARTDKSVPWVIAHY